MKSMELGNNDGLFLRNRQQIELAWLAIMITGTAPSIEPILDAYITWSSSITSMEGHETGSLVITGEAGQKAKGEIIDSVQFYVDMHPDATERSLAMQGLLAFLNEE